MTERLVRSVVQNKYVVSTVKFAPHFGIATYETMVFNYNVEAGKVTDWRELDCLRANMAMDAFINHTELMAKWGAFA